ncbi:MAG: class I SAM-dependent methyltransferase [Acidimicrobiales bacterium]
MIYRWKITLLKTRYGQKIWRRLPARQRRRVKTVEDHIREFAPGHSFADIGCMWGVDGEYSFIAEEAGATRVVGVDVEPATPKFFQKKEERQSTIEFIQGDGSDPEILTRIGVVDVVLCSGVLYHHPSPFDLLVVLRRMTSKVLILSSATIPEVRGLPQASVYYPYLPESERQLWDLKALGSLCQVGISNQFQAHEGYANWFWGMTPSCVGALARSAGFRVDHVEQLGPFGHLFVCRPVDEPAEHRLPTRP